MVTKVTKKTEPEKEQEDTGQSNRFIRDASIALLNIIAKDIKL